jgi:hypothetical protein
LRLSVCVLAVALTLGLAGPASAAAPDWSAWAPLEEVEVITSDADGASREHTIWIAVSEGAGPGTAPEGAALRR